MPNRLLSYREQIFALRDMQVMIRLYWWPPSELMLLRAHRIFRDSFWKEWYFQVWRSTQLCIPVLNILHQESREAKTLPTRSKGPNIDGVWKLMPHPTHSVLSRLLLGGAAPPYCPNIPPYQCLRGCCTPDKSHGMQSWSVFTNYYQTVIHIQVHSNRLHNSDAHWG